MLLMIFIMACTEGVVEVNNLTRPGQYVSVRMNIPGMAATATRAADGVIESVTALSFNSEGTRLGVNSVSNIENLNADGGYNGTFNLSVPDGTTIIHFLANLPNGYNLKSVTKLSDLTTLTTDDKNLTYWGVAEYTGSSLFVDLYRNMAMIAISPPDICLTTLTPAVCCPAGTSRMNGVFWWKRFCRRVMYKSSISWAKNSSVGTNGVRALFA